MSVLEKKIPSIIVRSAMTECPFVMLLVMALMILRPMYNEGGHPFCHTFDECGDFPSSDCR